MCRYCGDSTCCGGCWSELLTCLRQLCCCYGGDIEDNDLTEYRQEGTIPFLEKDSTESNSDDKDEYWGSGGPMNEPGDIENKKPFLKKGYNCWGWAVVPLTEELKAWDPPNCSESETHDNFIEKVFEYIKVLVGESNVKQLPKAEMEKIIGNVSNDQMVIALRTGELISQSGSGRASVKIAYHFAKYIFGQWTYKDGEQGVLVAYKTKEPPSLEPDTVWTYHKGLVTKAGDRKFLRDQTGNITKKPHYTSKTVYFLINLKNKLKSK